MQPHEDWRGRRLTPGIAPALIVIGIGVLFLLNNLNIFFVHDIWRFWPGILIAVGLVKMVDSATPNGRVVGGIVAGVGGLFLADKLGFLNPWVGELRAAGADGPRSACAVEPFSTPAGRTPQHTGRGAIGRAQRNRHF